MRSLVKNIGLFTGISVITFAEITYWMIRFCITIFKQSGRVTLTWLRNLDETENKRQSSNAKRSESVDYSKMTSKNLRIEIVES